jgi:hypothetical protein
MDFLIHGMFIISVTIWFAMSMCVVAIIIKIFTFIVFKKEVCVKYAAVTQIGECNAEGYCATMLDDGTRSDRYLPLIGDQVCSKTEIRKRW